MTVAAAQAAWRLAAPGLFAAAASLVVAASLLGGASQDNDAPSLVLELIALPVGALAIRRLLETGGWRAARWPLAVLAALLALPALQSLPLPPAVWTRLPGQATRLRALDLAGAPLGWRPVSLYPRATLASLPALLPAAALFVATLASPRPARRALAGVWLLMTALGLLLGLWQLGSETGGPAYLYGETNVGSLVGLFANRNHEAALLLAVLPLGVALSLHGRGRAWAAAPLAGIVLVALAADRSRAGVILAAPVLAGCAALMIAARRRPSGRLDLALFAAAVGAAALAVGAFAATPLLGRFGAGSAPEFRYQAWPIVWGEALRHLPLGAGLGAFDRVFRAAEPLGLVAPAYFNHAHNDYLEALLETGLPGAALLGAAAAWLILATRRAWSAREGGLARGAGVGVAVLAAMSIVDYPLRTATLASLLAFLCGELAARGAEAPAGG